MRFWCQLGSILIPKKSQNRVLEAPWAFLGGSWAVLEVSWAILAALVASQVRLGSHLGHLGRMGERQGRVWEPTEPREEGAMHAAGCERERGGSLRRLQKPCQTALGILARLNVPGVRWRTFRENRTAFAVSCGADEGHARCRRRCRHRGVSPRRRAGFEWMYAYGSHDQRKPTS